MRARFLATPLLAGSFVAALVRAGYGPATAGCMDLDECEVLAQLRRALSPRWVAPGTDEADARASEWFGAHFGGEVAGESRRHLHPLARVERWGGLVERLSVRVRNLAVNDAPRRATRVLSAGRSERRSVAPVPSPGSSRGSRTTEFVGLGGEPVIHIVDEGCQYTVELTLPAEPRGRNNLTVYVVAKDFEQAHGIIRAQYPESVIHKINKTGNYWQKHVLIVDDTISAPRHPRTLCEPLRRTETALGAFCERVGVGSRSARPAASRLEVALRASAAVTSVMAESSKALRPWRGT